MNSLKSRLKILNKKFVINCYKFYERMVLPPQNMSLLELKRKEFIEKTKYLDLKVLYNLSEEEKNELRSKGYIVDINPKTIRTLHDFKISYNRHEGMYNNQRENYNMAIKSDSYYNDQLSTGLNDYNYERKKVRSRLRIKLLAIKISLLATIIYLYGKTKLNVIPTIRERVTNNIKNQIIKK